MQGRPPSLLHGILKSTDFETVISFISHIMLFFCFRSMYCVWRAYLEGTVQATQSRITACENYKVQVADPAKMVRLQKDQQLRKVR